MKLDLEQKILNPENKAIIFIDNSDEQKKEMTVRNALNFVMLSADDKKDETYYSQYSVLNKKLIKASINKSKYLTINRVDDKKFLKELIINSVAITLLIKSFILDMIENNGKFNLGD